MPRADTNDTNDMRYGGRLLPRCPACLLVRGLARVRARLDQGVHLGVPDTLGLEDGTLPPIARSHPYTDVLFAAALWASGRLSLLAVGRLPRVRHLVALAFMAFAAFACVYAVVNVVIFGILGGFITYPLLSLVGSGLLLAELADDRGARQLPALSGEGAGTAAVRAGDRRTRVLRLGRVAVGAERVGGGGAAAEAAVRA